MHKMIWSVREVDINGIEKVLLQCFTSNTNSVLSDLITSGQQDVSQMALQGQRGLL